MNLPNKLTILRVIMIPFFVFFLLSGVGGSASKWIALVIFAAASITDTLDGYIARRDNLITISESLWIRWQISCWYALH